MLNKILDMLTALQCIKACVQVVVPQVHFFWPSLLCHSKKTHSDNSWCTATCRIPFPPFGRLRMSFSLKFHMNSLQEVLLH